MSDVERDRKYGSDPEALAWARDKTQRAVDRLERMAEHQKSEGNEARAGGYRAAAFVVRNMLIGGEGCVVGSFDARTVDFYTIRCIHGHLLDDRSHDCVAAS